MLELQRSDWRFHLNEDGSWLAAMTVRNGYLHWERVLRLPDGFAVANNLECRVVNEVDRASIT